MNYCSHCGSGVHFIVPSGDHLPRHVCPQCGQIHYQNPRIIVGCVPVWQDKILICKRAIEPRHGYWTLPAGFMENGETVADGAARETREEALADVEIGSLLAVVNVLHTHQVHMMFRGRLKRPEFGAGIESLEVKLIHPDEIPWDDLAFESVSYTLKRFLEDTVQGVERMHMHTIP
jgi:ADP-ribose pyrophosphatase YjhB (NUDIX family)